jgi:lysophospholipase L1-like esterase
MTEPFGSGSGEGAQTAVATSWRARVALVAGSALLTMGLCDALLWALLPIEHPYASAVSHDKRVYDEFRRSPLNRYIPSYHLPKSLAFRPDRALLPGVSEAVSFVVNDFGFRNSRMTTIDKPAGEIRMFAVGGSTTECLYLDEHDAWTEVLQRRLATRHPTVNVINAGRSGDTTRDHLALLSQRLIAYSPDYVVFLVGVNDLGLHLERDYSAVRDDARSTVPESRATMGVLLWSRAADVSQLARRLINVARSRLKEDSRGNPVQDTVGRWVESARQKRTELKIRDVDVESFPRPEYEQNIRALVHVTRSAGAVPVLVTQPVLWGAPPGDWEKLLWVTHGGRVPQQDLWKLMERFNHVLRRIAADLDIRLIDLSRSLPKSTSVFYDDDHFTVEGARLVGEFIADGIMDR